MSALREACHPRDVYTEAMVCQHLGSLYGQRARFAEATGYYRRAADALTQLLAVDEANQSRCFLAAAYIGAGQLGQARATLAELGPLPVTSSAEPTREDHSRAVAVSAYAELCLAEGDVERGLPAFALALELSGWPESETSVGPFGVLVASATVCAHVRHGRAATMGAVVDEIAEYCDRALRRYTDVPQLGAAALAIGGYLAATGADPVVAADFVALARQSMARQDYPSMRWDWQADAARAALGDETIDAALARAAELTKSRAASAIVDLVSGYRPGSRRAGDQALRM
jgi:tetratricopeptide (TPR) repeat protein